MFITRNRKFFVILTTIFVVLSIASLLFKGIPVGIEFKGGSIIEMSYEFLPDKVAVETELQESFESFSLRQIGEKGYALRTTTLSQESQEQAIQALRLGGIIPGTVERVSDIGPTIGAELQRKAWISIVLVGLLIILYVAFAFRGSTHGVSGWTYGWVSIVTLLHDIIVPAGLFVWYAAATGAELDVLVVMAILAILGYSINDTVVIFDRVRENLRLNDENNKKEPFEETVGKSLSQSLTRSINTSVTTALVLVAIFFLGSASTKAFSFFLLMGVIAGSYSSICFAAPLLTWFKRKEVKK